MVECGGSGGRATTEAAVVGSKAHLLSVEIPFAEANYFEDRWKSVTVYSIRATAVGRREVWTVYRRYSKFLDLRVQLSKRFPGHALPPIPPKKILGKEDPQFIEQRRRELEEFLHTLLEEPAEISLSEEVCLFLEVPPTVNLHVLAAEGRQPGTGLRSYGAGATGPTALGVASDAGESRVERLLLQLRDLSNSKVVSIRSFESWFLKVRPKVRESDVQLLYLGLEQKGGGLLEEVGAFEQSEVSSIVALGLLCKLLSHEYCSEAALFQRVLRQMDLLALSRMRLQHHIHRNRGKSNRLDAFHVLDSLDLSEARLSELLQDEFSLIEFRRWHEGLQSWLSFRTLHRPSLTRRRAASAEHSGLLPRSQLNPCEYRKLAENAIASLQQCFTMYSLPSDCVQTARPPDAVPAFIGAAAESEGISTSGLEASAAAGQVPRASPRRREAPTLPPAAIDADSACSEARWHRVPCHEAKWATLYQTRVFYQHMPFEHHTGACVVRGKMRLPFRASLVALLLADHKHFINKALELKAAGIPSEAVSRLEHLAAGQLVSQLQSVVTLEQPRLGASSFDVLRGSLLECNLGCPSAPHVAVRLWLLKCLCLIPAGGSEAGAASAENAAAAAAADADSYLFVWTAVPPVTMGLQSEVAGMSMSGAEVSGLPSRAFTPTSSPSNRPTPPRIVNLKPSGVLLHPIAEGETEVNLLALLAKDGIKLISGDLLGERLLFWKTLENILFVLETLCPLPLDFASSLAQRQELPEACLPASQPSDGSHSHVSMELVTEATPIG